MAPRLKDWNAHVSHAEEVSRGAGFGRLRDDIVALAAPRADDVVVDVGAGTGLLALALAARVERVWAVDIAPQMCEYLRVKAKSGGLTNIEPAVSTATSLPLVDASADLVVSNYCFHHLTDAEKLVALAEVHRVLRPGGRLVFGDMMFRVSLADGRDRAVIRDKVRGLARKGPAGFARLAKNAVRMGTGRWERPARADWWSGALESTGFADVSVRVLDHEGGLASARRP